MALQGEPVAHNDLVSGSQTALHSHAGGGGGISEYMIMLCAEENQAIGAGTFEWAIGNGSNTPSGKGVVMFVPSGWEAHIVGMSLDLNAGSATVEAHINGVNIGVSDGVEVASTALATAVSVPPFQLVNGDNMNFRTRLASGTSTSNRVAMWIRMTKP